MQSKTNVCQYLTVWWRHNDNEARLQTFTYEILCYWSFHWRLCVSKRRHHPLPTDIWKHLQNQHMDHDAYIYRLVLFQCTEHTIFKGIILVKSNVAMKKKHNTCLTHLSELSPIGLYLSLNEFGAHDSPKKLMAFLTWLLQSMISMPPSCCSCKISK